MFDFGDDLFIGSHKIPWLVWIQLIVMLLLVILLYYFISFALGLDPSPTAAASSSSSSSAVLRSEISRQQHPPIATAVSAAVTAASSRSNTAKVGESHSIRGDVGTSTSRRRVRREEIQKKEGSSSAKDATDAPVLDRYYHPCHYLGWARQAFLKCLGLDPPSSNPSSNTRHRKEN